jgi:hypothetical protein
MAFWWRVSRRAKLYSISFSEVMVSMSLGVGGGVLGHQAEKLAGFDSAVAVSVDFADEFFDFLL